MLEREIAQLPHEQLAMVLGRLEGLRFQAFLRAIEGKTDGHDELVSAAEAARRLGVSRQFLYRRANSLPFVIRIGRGLRFSVVGIEKYIRQRQQH